MGHSMNYHKDYGVIVYGGEKLFNSSLKMRECLSDLRLYNLDKNEWKLPRCYGDLIESRRNHGSCIISKFLFIIGGVGSTGKVLNDIGMLNLETLKWT